MKRFLWIVVLIGGGGLIAWLALRKPPPPEVRFTRVTREPLISELTTNGKAEPIEWSPVRADRAGRIETVHVVKGAIVAAGAPLVTLDAREERDAVARAQARVAQVEAEIAQLDAGGRSAERVALEASLRNLRVESDQLKREIASVGRLLEKHAATIKEKKDLEDRLARITSEMQGLERRRAALVDSTDKAAAEARLREAQAALDAARDHLDRCVIRTLRAGEVYNLPVRAGSYVQPGDLIADIGDLNRLRVIIYVDEPELGRVRLNLPVTVTWDGLPGSEWTGKVDKLPVQIIAQGSRQIGEVQSLVENPGHILPAGANINARIRTARLDQALVIPKECIARQNGKTIVYVLKGTKVEAREVRLGVSSVAKSEVISGLTEGEQAAVLTDQPLASGMTVRLVE